MESPPDAGPVHGGDSEISLSSILPEQQHLTSADLRHVEQVWHIKLRRIGSRRPCAPESMYLVTEGLLCHSLEGCTYPLTRHRCSRLSLSITTPRSWNIQNSRKEAM